MVSQGLRVVLTGPAYDNNGVPVLRADLVVAMRELGMVPQSIVAPDTQLLVASRDDTTKARRAAERGIDVITYADFMAEFGIAVRRSGAVRNAYVDTHTHRGPDVGLLGGDVL